MLFDDKKLSTEDIDDLLQCPVESIAPFVLMLAPVYVFMKLNKKFVSVKAPLDFFLPDELEKLKKHEVFYVPKIVKSSVRYQTAARLVKNLFSLNTTPANLIGMSSFEVSNETVKIMGTLWGKEVKIEPFFMAVFTHEFCRPLNSNVMIDARESTVVRHDYGLLLSGVFVFTAIHLGWHDYDVLNQLRDDIYDRTVKGEDWNLGQNTFEIMVGGISQLMSQHQSIGEDQLLQLNQEWSQKLIGRLQRIKRDVSHYAECSPSIYGPEGFAS